MATLGAEQAAPAPPASYEAALRQYAAGERKAAVASIGELQWRTLDEGFSRIRREIERASRCPDCSDTLKEPIRAAVMLHLDRDLVDNPPLQAVEQARPCGGRHAERALEYASLLARRERTREFARRFFVAMTWRAEWDACMHQARAWSRTGLNLFPEDPDLRLALGVTHEKAARLGTGDPERPLREARRELSLAVNSASVRQLAGVHLGRVLWRLGFADESQRTLEAVVAEGGDDRLLYLAHVFLGQVHERKGRAELATMAFRRALQIMPHGQAAAVGLAHSLLVQGDTTGAASAAERALSSTEPSPDPYRDYDADNAALAHVLFEALRLESLQ
jgi:tetratricopeptide (TPR) repeat protein